MEVNEKIKDAWLDYTSADPYQAEYFLMRYLKLLNKEQLTELLENFAREHGVLVKGRR